MTGCGGCTHAPLLYRLHIGKKTLPANREGRLLPLVLGFDLLRDVRRSRDAVEVEAAAAAVLAVGPYPGAASVIIAREPRAV